MKKTQHYASKKRPAGSDTAYSKKPFVKSGKKPAFSAPAKKAYDGPRRPYVRPEDRPAYVQDPNSTFRPKRVSEYRTKPSYKADIRPSLAKAKETAKPVRPATVRKAPETPKTTSWGAVASWYDTHLETNPDTFQDAVIAPNLLRLLDLKPGMKVLDLACGQGHFSRLFAQHNAQVTGADISPEVIAAAQKRSPKISYHATPAHKLGFAQGETFDAVTVVLAIQNIENMTEVFMEANRVLKPGGRLVLVMNHPVFRNPKETHWVYDQGNNKQYRRIDSYLSQATIHIEMHPGQAAAGKKTEQTVSYHRSLQDFFKALNKSGFAVARLEEWISHKKSQPGPRQKAEDTARKEIPMFLMLEGVKLRK